MHKIKIITDSTCDLEPQTVKEIDVEVIPLNVIFGEQIFKDGIEMNQTILYRMVDETKKLPKTSAVAPGQFIEVFKKYIDDGYQVLYTGIGSGFSGTFQSASIATAEFPKDKVRLVDSQNLSTGTGLLVLKATKLVKEGKSLEEIVATLEVLVPKVRAQFMVLNLEFLYKGGRCSAAKYYFGTLLRAHPIIAVRNGKMDVFDTPKGKQIKALNRQLDMFKEDLQEGIDEDWVLITSSDAEEAEKYYIEELSKLIKPESIMVSKAGAVISSHCGRGTIGILYIKK